MINIMIGLIVWQKQPVVYSKNGEDHNPLHFLYFYMDIKIIY